MGAITILPKGGSAGPLKYAQCQATGWLFSADYGTRGTCCLIAPDWILTCGHLIPDAYVAADFVVAFEFAQGEAPANRVSRALRADKESFVTGWPDVDFTIVRLRTPVRGLGAYPLKQAVAPKPGLEVVCLQHPDEMDSWKCFSLGKVGKTDVPDFEHDAPAADGSSGGPLLDREGHLVGIHRGLPDAGAAFIATTVPAILDHLRQPHMPDDLEDILEASK
ncbi:hypothetical protein BWI17_01965 [Betaproteobacteria bacterium GR16-43]|nr:hypothetical protein BWI17_01965 [Betaproteobacteria bacterium GR16-43]